MIDNYPAGRIVIGLFGEIAPKTVKNFITLATSGVKGKAYAGTRFHRVMKRYLIQAGDVEQDDGYGSISIYGKYFEDETFQVKHTAPLFVSMANIGKDTNGCQFFITTVMAPWLDGYHTAFGKVVNGEATVYRIEQVKTDNHNNPLVPIVIYSCGVLPMVKSYTISDKNYDYDIWEWIKATYVPLGFSFLILAIFHRMIKQLDV
ncbi:hypothetical protein HN011_010728 [Eciton burchellii]|nr:hypothetical protein HN011_010728 [Eciton burchellii]